MTRKGPLVCVILAAAVSVGREDRERYRGIVQFDLVLKETASGGNLVLARTRNRNARYISIPTSSGESAESVVHRLADAVNAHHSISAQSPDFIPEHQLWAGGYQATAVARALRLPGTRGDYSLAGTETGLGVPKPPLSLSASYDSDQDKVALHWINPSPGYDLILVKCFWKDFDHVRTDRVPGKATSFTIDRKKLPVNIADMDLRVIGFRENIPSNAAALHVAGTSQEELYGVPFTGGVAPNWSVWTTARGFDGAGFDQGHKYGALRQHYNPALALLTKPFRQIIRAPQSGITHGVYRKFLGLTPGHTYRLTACLTTLDMDSAEGDWSLSLCAAHNGAGETDLTVQQLAGLAALPDGRSGPEAGRIAFYNPGKTTKGERELVFSDNPPEGEPESLNITLPGGADIITVWVRFACSDPNGKVGFSGVKLEDITANPNPKPWQAIERAEFKEEADLLRREQKALQRSVR